MINIYFSESLFITVADSRPILFHGALMNIRKIPCGFPSGKRELILSLASSLIGWDKMVKDESLSNLTTFPGIHESIKITRPYDKISSIASLALERDEIQKSWK